MLPMSSTMPWVSGRCVYQSDVVVCHVQPWPAEAYTIRPDRLPFGWRPTGP